MDKPPRKSTGREIAERIIEAGLGVVPVVGSPLAVAFTTAVGWTYNRRMATFLDDLAEAVSDLQQRTDGRSFEELAGEDAFVDAVVAATRAAQATHQDEKLVALRNGVLNTLAPDAPTLDEQARFFRLIEEFTPAHLRLLTFLNDPGAIFDAAGLARPQLMTGSRRHLINEGMPEFKDQRSWVELLDRDLGAAGLINHGGLYGVQSGGSLWGSATSELGRRFLAFVSEPTR